MPWACKLGGSRTSRVSWEGTGTFLGVWSVSKWIVVSVWVKGAVRSHQMDDLLLAPYCQPGIPFDCRHGWEAAYSWTAINIPGKILTSAGSGGRIGN